MGSLEFASKQIVVNCVRVQPFERIVIITDRHARSIADAVYHEILNISRSRSSQVRIFVMEEYGNRPEQPTMQSPALAFPEEIGNEISKAQVSFYIASGKKGELQSFRSPMLQAIEKNRHLRHAHMPGITLPLMEMGMSVDYAKVQELSAKVYDICYKAREIRVTTPAGTDFTAYFNPTWHWKISDGNISTPGEWSNLPDGEVFTCVESIPDGKIVVDGVLGDFFSEKYGLLEKNPVTIYIKDSRVAKAECDRKDLVVEFMERLACDENANRVGEFAIGTNIGLTHLVGNLLQDEKFPGIHVAFGHGYPEKTGSPWHSQNHIDAVLKKTTIIVDGYTIMRDGDFLI